MFRTICFSIKFENANAMPSSLASSEDFRETSYYDSINRVLCGKGATGLTAKVVCPMGTQWWKRNCSQPDRSHPRGEYAGTMSNWYHSNDTKIAIIDVEILACERILYSSRRFSKRIFHGSVSFIFHVIIICSRIEISHGIVIRDNRNNPWILENFVHCSDRDILRVRNIFFINFLHCIIASELKRLAIFKTKEKKSIRYIFLSVDKV